MTMRLAFRFSQHTLFNRITARVTGGPNHVAVLFADDAYEADWDWRDMFRSRAKRQGGVRRRNTNELLESGEWVIAFVPCSPLGAAVARFWCSKRVGQPYSLLGLVAWKLGRLATKWDPQRFICSKFAGGACNSTTEVTLSRERLGWYTPNRLYEEARASGWLT
jgi:hypothetical protein